MADLHMKCREITSSCNVLHIYSGSASFNVARGTDYPDRYFTIFLVPPSKCQDSASWPLPLPFHIECISLVIHSFDVIKGTGWRLVSARRGHALCPDKGSVHGHSWPRREHTSSVIWRGFPRPFRDQIWFPWLAQTEAVLPVCIVGMELSLNRPHDDAIHVSVTLYIPVVFSQRSSLTDWRKLDTDLMLSRDSTLRDIPPCCSLKVNRCLGGTCCLHL
jgi:hypothetical protein